MNLHSIRLRNFRQHADTEVTFGPGLTGIIGGNGAGKSTILEALAWALYGADAIRGTVGTLRWHRAPQGKAHGPSVRLMFSVGREQYVIEREEGDTYLEKRGGAQPLEASGTTAVNAAVRELLGLTLAEFRATYLCEQKDLLRLSALRPEERRTFIRGVMGIGRLDDAVKACRAERSQARAERDGAAQGLGERGPVQAEASLARIAAEDASDERERAWLAFGVERSCEDFTGSTYRKSVKRAEQHAALTRQQEDATREAERAQGEIDRLTAELAEAEAAAARVREKVESGWAPGAAAENLRMVREERLGKLSQARAWVDHLQSHLVRQCLIAERIKDMGRTAPCPTCTRPLGEDLDRVLDALHQDIAETETEIVGETKRRDELAQSYPHEIAQAENVARLEREDRALAEDRVRAGRVDALQVKIENFRAAEYSFSCEAGDTAAQVRALAFDAAAHAALQQAAEEARRAREQAAVALATAEGALRAAEARRERAEAALADYDARAGVLAALTERCRVLDAADERLAAFRTAQVAGIRPEMEELVSGFVAELTDGLYESARIGEDFGVTLHRGGIPCPVPSGGEEDVVAIALRLATSLMIAQRAGHHLGCLILDEPFGSQDEGRRRNILDLVTGLGGLFPQVIVISHFPELQHRCANAMLVERDDARGCSVVQNLNTAGV